MGRAPCCDKANVKKGPWSPEEDAKLKEYIDKFGTGGNWIALPQKAGLKRCGKSCRLRWLNYLRPNIKHGEFSDDEDRIICSLYASIGSRWSIIAAQLPGRTDNDIKNYWNTKLKKKLMGMIPLDQRKLPLFSSNSLTNSSSPQSHQSFSSLSQLYRDCTTQPYYYTTSTKSSCLLTGYDAHQSLISSVIQPNMLYNNINLTTTANHSYNLQGHVNQDQGLISPMQFYPGKDNMLVFGGADNQASCSSSDGSCSQISYGNKEIKQEQMNGFCNFSNNMNGFSHHQENQRFMLDHYGNQMNTTTAAWGANNNAISTTQLQYDLEEVKQLMITSSNMGLLLNDENKTHESRGAMYYYNY
ncbi:hypothetical protein ACH5RR_021017 [Cinchona calisaya]|uniref:Uncharacterized protein n=1 Tax=Cinchona calisaya TaxID=153742 RepID=A0ABD2ZG88_9GENT